MRIMECLRLRVKDVDFELRELTVRDGKGAKDRMTVLPASVVDELRKHLEQLLVDGEQKIRRLKEKYDAVKDEYGKQAEDAAKEVQANVTAEIGRAHV